MNYFALRVWHNDVMECKDLQSQGMWSEGLGKRVMSKEEVMSVLRSFGMEKFAGAVMWVLNEVFGGGNENLSNHRMTRRNTEECPQADGEGRQQEQHKTTLGPQADGDEWSDTAKLMSTDEINNERIMLRNGQELFTHKKSKAEFIKLKQVPDD